MANITTYLEQIKNALYGKDVRGSIHDGIDAINNEVENTTNRQEHLEDTFNQLVINSGNSNAEIVDARVGENGKNYEKLGDRLDEVDSQLEHNMNEVNDQFNNIINRYEVSNGEIILPNDFPKLPFKIFRNNGKYSVDVNALNCVDLKDALHIYLSENGGTTDGTSVNSPISLGRFINNLNSSVYGENKKFIVNILDNVMYEETGGAIIEGDFKILFRSVSSSGHSWVGRIQHKGKHLNAWSEYEGIFKTTQTKNSYDIIDILNPTHNDYDEFIKVNSIEECKNTLNSYYQSGFDIYVNPKDRSNIDSLCCVVSTTILNINPNSNSKIIFENLNWVAYSLRIYPTSLDSEIYFFNCLFTKNPNDSIAFQGEYRTYLINCKAINGQKDGFNYHTTNNNSLAIEVNCEAYNAGVYKTFSGGNQTTNSNNGSTAHDGMKVARFGCIYSNCQGPIVADVNGCYSINYDVQAIKIAQGNSGKKASFYFNDGKALLYNCTGGGDNVDFGVCAEEGADCTVYNFKGKQIFSNNVKFGGK